MLECRLTQFGDSAVYRHVLVEAAVDHQGHPKPLHYLENRERFSPWADRIIHVVAGELPGMTCPGMSPRDAAWAREGAQRDATGLGLADADPDDWLIVADLDEIPNAAALRAVQDRRTGCLEGTFCMFAADWVLPRQMPLSGICAAGAVTSFMKTRRESWYWDKIPGTGHHLSWFGGQEAIAAKMASHCHLECNGDLAAGNAGDRLYRQGLNPFPGALPGPLLAVDVDETWPRYVWNQVAGEEPCCPADWFRPR